MSKHALTGGEGEGEGVAEGSISSFSWKVRLRLRPARYKQGVERIHNESLWVHPNGLMNKGKCLVFARCECYGVADVISTNIYTLVNVH